MTINYKSSFDRVDAISRVIRNVLFLGATVWMIYSSTIGPGIKAGIRDFVGTTALSEQVAFLEENMAPPRVANWEANSVIGDCTMDRCVVRHFISRTEYGAECGRPSASAETRQNGVISDLPLRDFQAVEATQRGIAVNVPLALQPPIGPGVLEYRFINIYPTCPWAREPIPRVSPWFSLEVDPQR